MRRSSKESSRGTVPAFDAFLAIDWSGATGAYIGIAVARCEAGVSAPYLVSPPNAGRWTRTGIADWLSRQLDGNRRLLIGLDFAFGVPYEETHGYLAGNAREAGSIFELWNLIDEQSAADTDFGCGKFVSDKKYASLFWKSGARPTRWVERKRQTELACGAATQTYPDTVYKLLGSKQVGKASITGMRVLNHVRSLNRRHVAIWPFEKVRSSAMVEIYPTLFRKAATRSVAKLRSLEALNRALGVLGSQSIQNPACKKPSDHETDALLSAAGLRRLASLPEVWSPAVCRSAQVQREGWIFGVGGSPPQQGPKRGI